MELLQSRNGICNTRMRYAITGRLFTMRLKPLANGIVGRLFRNLRIFTKVASVAAHRRKICVSEVADLTKKKVREGQVQQIRLRRQDRLPLLRQCPAAMRLDRHF